MLLSLRQPPKRGQSVRHPGRRATVLAAGSRWRAPPPRTGLALSPIRTIPPRPAAGPAAARILMLEFCQDTIVPAWLTLRFGSGRCVNPLRGRGYIVVGRPTGRGG